MTRTLRTKLGNPLTLPDSSTPRTRLRFLKGGKTTIGTDLTGSTPRSVLPSTGD